MREHMCVILYVHCVCVCASLLVCVCVCTDLYVVCMLQHTPPLPFLSFFYLSQDSLYPCFVLRVHSYIITAHLVVLYVLTMYTATKCNVISMVSYNSASETKLTR